MFVGKRINENGRMNDLANFLFFFFLIFVIAEIRFRGRKIEKVPWKIENSGMFCRQRLISGNTRHAIYFDL